MGGYALDSSYDLPDDAGLRQAAAAGVKCWFGYAATKAGVGLAATWPKANFDRIKAAGMATGAFVSGWDDPAALRSLGQSWGILLQVDVEGGGLRPDGQWVQGFLDQLAGGLYGNFPVMAGRRATHYIGAAYPGGAAPAQSWPAGEPLPPGPHGWQSQGTHTEFGASVDRGYYDDWIVTGGDMTADEVQKQIDASLAPLKAESDGLYNRIGMWLYARHLGRTFDQAWFDYWKPRFAGTLAGPDGSKGWESALDELRNTPEAKNFRASGIPDLANHPGTHDATAWPAPGPVGGASATHEHDLVIYDEAGHQVTVTSGQPKG